MIEVDAGGLSSDQKLICVTDEQWCHVMTGRVLGLWMGALLSLQPRRRASYPATASLKLVRCFITRVFSIWIHVQLVQVQIAHTVFL